MIRSNGNLRWMFQFGFLCIMSLGLASSVSGSLSFEIHHRFSEQVKTVLGGHGLPEMGSLDYYKALVHRDRGRRLTSNNNQTTISFAQGNSTEEISFLHYANVTIGTPAQWFLVALDTGSDLFWLPCNCNSTCVRSMETDQGERIRLNIYNPSISTSSSKVTCNSTLCALRNRCISPLSDCPYRIRYLSPGSKSTGVLVEDVIHMSTEEGEARDARITFGCSETQLGLFQEVAVNGIMGLAMADIAVPNMLVKAGVASDSFSMCFGPNGKGTISFGDKGSSDQHETPLGGTISPLFYDVSITKFKVGKVTVETKFSAIFDSGTAVTWLLDPYYTALTTNFHLSVPDRRLPADVDSTFEFCYIITSTCRNTSVNGVLGLGIKDYSVPSLLAKANITANSFSMCFGRVIGNVRRISFGDKGYTDQEETPFISVAPSTAYGVNVTGVTVGGDDVDIRLFAKFDTGSSFTHLLEPAYGVLTKSFDDLVEDKRRPVVPELPFEFCYDLSPNATSIEFPLVEMKFVGGSKIILNNPFFTARTQEGNVMYCLGVLKSVGRKINVIGQNFVAGYRIVFDRERRVLGWKPSLCFEDESLESTTPPPPEIEAPAPSVSAPPPRSLPPAVSATPPPIDPRNSTRNPGTGGAANLIPLTSQLLLLLPLLVFI